MKSAAYKLYPHGDLESPIGGVWMVTGRSAFPLYRRMTVWKLPDGTLLAHSVIAMDDARMAALDALGRLSIILVPNSIHRLDAGFYKKHPGRDVAVKELTLNPPTDNSKGLRIGNFVQIRDVVDEELESVWSGKKDAKAALDEAVKRGNELLRKFEAANK